MAGSFPARIARQPPSSEPPRPLVSGLSMRRGGVPGGLGGAAVGGWADAFVASFFYFFFRCGWEHVRGFLIHVITFIIVVVILSTMTTATAAAVNTSGAITIIVVIIANWIAYYC